MELGSQGGHSRVMCSNRHLDNHGASAEHPDLSPSTLYPCHRQLKRYVLRSHVECDGYRDWCQHTDEYEGRKSILLSWL